MSASRTHAQWVTLQSLQTTSLLALLNLNTPSVPTPQSVPSRPGTPVPVASAPPVWKVLVLDETSKDVLATVLRVQDLRDVGVTLHVLVPVL
jgi:hypothetical protein